METLRITADERGITRAAERLAAGAVVAFPTDTVYGLGASVACPQAVAALYAVKQRPADKPFAVLVADVAMARRYASVWSPLASALADAFWPGPLTLVVPRSPTLSAGVVCGGATVALRVPDHQVARALALALGEGIAAPSANRSGEPPPTDADAVVQQLGGRIPLVLDGGSCLHGVPSTIVAVEGAGLRLLREGAISRAVLAEYTS